MPSPAHFIIGIESTQLNSNDIQRLAHPCVVGCILFARNYTDPEQLKSLTDSIRHLRSDLLISIDHEGGRVQRLRGKGFTDLCAPFELRLAPEFDIRSHARTMCLELQAVGIDLSYAPVVDRYQDNSKIIHNRAFSDDFEQISNIASIYIDTMHQCGMPSVLKHFPGHGAVLDDTHIESSIDGRCYEQITETDIAPFVTLMANGQADGVMISHISYPRIDDKIASMSRFWMTDVLRNTLGFEGIIFSDDLDMKAVSKEYNNIIDMCNDFFTAGGDIALLCNNFNNIDKALAYFPANTDPRFGSRWFKFFSRVAPQ